MLSAQFSAACRVRRLLENEKGRSGVMAALAACGLSDGGSGFRGDGGEDGGDNRAVQHYEVRIKDWMDWLQYYRRRSQAV